LARVFFCLRNVQRQCATQAWACEKNAWSVF